MPTTLTKYTPYARMAYRYGPTALRYGRRIAKWAGRRYKSRYTRRKGRGYLRGAKRMRFSPKSFGEQIGSSLTKTRVMNLTNSTSQNTRTLYTLNLTQIPKGQARNERERSLVNFRGVRICIAMRNTTLVPMYVNWAVVHPKVDESAAPSQTNFFRSSASDRGLNFSSALTALQFHCLRMNTDKFTILKHKRFELCPAGNSAQYGANGGWSWKNLEWYIKIKRQLRYEDDSSVLPVTGNVFLVHWFDREFDDATQGPRADEMVVQESVISYFRDAKN